MFRTLPTATVFAAVLTVGLVPGLWAGRWASSNGLDEACKRLFLVPRAVSEWVGQDVEVNKREQESAQASSILRRRYVNSRTGEVVTLMVLCGRSGPIAVHTPDVCYKGSGYDEIGEPARYDVPTASGNQLRVRLFQKASTAPTFLRVMYGWNSAGAWTAPDNPRLKFAGCPLLYKLYLVHELSRPDEPLDGDPAGDLFRALVSPLGAALFPAA